LEKIFLISKLPPPYYGTTVWSEILLNSSLKSHYQIVHFNNNIHKDISTLGKFSFKKVFLNILLYLKFGRKLNQNKVDLVFLPISQTTIGFIKDSIYIFLCKLHRKKVLLILHGSDFQNWVERSNYLIKIYVEKCLKLSCGIVVLGEKLKIIFAAYYPQSKIFSVPNGANYNFPHGRSSETLRLLYLGNLQPSKGIEDILSSLVLLKASNSFFRLDVVGKWRNEEMRLESLRFVEYNKLPVHFHEPVFGEKKLEYLSNSDLFVFTPRGPEGHPLVIVEALAAGLPIISTDKGSITESVLDGINGFIVEPNNPEQIASRITYLIQNPEIREKMSQASRRLYEERFTEEKMVENLCNVFSNILHD
jgi:glycosyltransferase involved in cell wall biosynthesis